VVAVSDFTRAHWRTCTHEASHAVATYLLGGVVREIRFDGHGGTTDIDFDRGQPPRQRLFEYAVAAAVGILVEPYPGGPNQISANWDAEQIHRLRGVLGEGQGWVSSVNAKAKELIDSRAFQAALADLELSLATHFSLRGEQVEAIIEAALRDLAADSEARAAALVELEDAGLTTGEAIAVLTGAERQKPRSDGELRAALDELEDSLR